MSEDLKFSYDTDGDVITIEGIHYSGEVFRQLGGLLPAGEIFKLVKRSDGILTIFKWD